MSKYKRTHMCGELSNNDIGKEVTLTGWVQKSRDLGGLLFLDLRDRSGIIQVIFDKEKQASLFDNATSIRSEYVILISGIVRKRDGAINKKMKTGEIEVMATSVDIISKAETPPIYIEDDLNASESLRLK